MGNLSSKKTRHAEKKREPGAVDPAGTG